MNGFIERLCSGLRGEPVLFVPVSVPVSVPVVDSADSAVQGSTVPLVVLSLLSVLQFHSI